MHSIFYSFVRELYNYNNEFTFIRNMETRLEFKQVFILVWKNVFYEFEGFKGLRIVREFPEYQRKLLRSNIDFVRIF